MSNTDRGAGPASRRRSAGPRQVGRGAGAAAARVVGSVLGITVDGCPPAEATGGRVERWVSLAEAERLGSGDAPHPGHLVVAAPEPAAAATIVARLATVGLGSAVSVLLTADGAVQTARTLQQLQTALDNIPAPIFSKDADGVYGACNTAFEAFVGVPRGKIIGRTVFELWPRELADMYDRADRALMAAGGSQIYDAQVRYADGSVHDVTFYKGVFTDDAGAVQGLSGAILDITERRALESRLRLLADTDPLTGAANRAAFSRRLDEAAAGPCHPPAVLLIDLDDFKVINDSLGHGVGDALLVAVSELLRHHVRGTDMVARLGGDEFAVLVCDPPEHETDALVRRILGALARPVAAAGRTLAVHASIGVAHGRPGDRGEDLLRHADIALYTAKDAGKGRCARYHPGMKARLAEQAALLDGLHHALTDHQVYVDYQPVVRLADGAVVGLEALARWRHPTRGPVSPTDFVPIAERSGLIIPLGRWVIDQACRQAAQWQRRATGDNPPATHVNVSARQLHEPEFPAHLRQTLDETGLDPAGLVLEITEATATDDAAVLEALHAIRRLGVRVALDDFGAGQSTLGILAHCPVDLIKVDRSIIEPVTDSERHAAIARSIVGLADSLGIDTIAEGVETAAQAHRLYELGYRQAQGFHFARPLTPEAVDQLL